MFGFETSHKDIMCSWSHNHQWHLDKILELGFNYIRLPFSVEYIQEGDFSNMDHFFFTLKSSKKYENIKVALDCHRLHSNYQSAKPYDDTITFDIFLQSWRIILDRYKDISNIEQVDIFNEYQSSNSVEWSHLAVQTILYIEKYFPCRFLYMIGGTEWGGNLSGLSITRLYEKDQDSTFKNRISFTVHKYHWSDKGTESEMVEKWDSSFGHLSFNNDDRPPVNVGEFGYKSEQPFESRWAELFVTT